MWQVGGEECWADYLQLNFYNYEDLRSCCIAYTGMKYQLINSAVSRPGIESTLKDSSVFVSQKTRCGETEIAYSA